MYGDDIRRLALCAENISMKYGIDIIVTPQTIDIPLLTSELKHIHVFAQHMDPIRTGRGIGMVLPEALKAAGTEGVLLNHAEKRMTISDINKAIKRADEVGLTHWCSDWALGNSAG